MTELTKRQFNLLHKAMLDTLDHDSLRFLLRSQMDVKLEHISELSNGLIPICHKVIDWMERRERIEELVESLVNVYPNNNSVQDLVREFDADELVPPIERYRFESLRYILNRLSAYLWRVFLLWLLLNVILIQFDLFQWPLQLRLQLGAISTLAGGMLILAISLGPGSRGTALHSIADQSLTVFIVVSSSATLFVTGLSIAPNTPGLQEPTAGKGITVTAIFTEIPGPTTPTWTPESASKLTTMILPAETPIAEPTVMAAITKIDGYELSSRNTAEKGARNEFEIGPRATIEGYSSILGTNQSLHLIIRELLVRREIRVAPMISNVDSTGSWSIELAFDEEGLRLPQRYEISLAVAISDDAREQLGLAAGLGLTELPQGVIPLNQQVAVERAAYRHIQGERLVFDSGSKLLVTTSLEGSDRQILYSAPEGRIVSEADISSTGTKLVFVLQDSQIAAAEPVLMVLNTTTDNLKQLDIPGAIVIEHPAWSPSERYIAYGARLQEENSGQLFIYDTITGATTQLTNHNLASRYPSWLSENEIVFSVIAEGSEGLYSINSQTGQLRPILNGPLEEFKPRVSPERTRIAFVAYLSDDNPLDDNHDVFVYDLAAEIQTRLTSFRGQDGNPAISSDSTTVFFSTQRNSASLEIWAVDIAGSSAQPVIVNEYGSADNPVAGYLDLFVPIRRP